MMGKLPVDTSQYIPLNPEQSLMIIESESVEDASKLTGE